MSGLVLDKREILHGETVKVLVQLKANGGQEFIDVRKWLRYPNNDDFWPTRKGITLHKDQWIAVMDKIKELLSASMCEIEPKNGK
ncbi:transcriptional coactivator p15/PC4 family protein [Candidatus Microgenomates bacterium]|nr:transcriptional coactivator p15/PC4 family protein [Candidatus Microgenomates bacterium]